MTERPVVSAPLSRPRCLQCNVETVPAHLGGLRVTLRPLGSRRGTVAEPRVCPRCGRVDFICPDPARFREQERE